MVQNTPRDRSRGLTQHHTLVRLALIPRICPRPILSRPTMPIFKQLHDVDQLFPFGSPCRMFLSFLGLALLYPHDSIHVVDGGSCWIVGVLLRPV